MSQHPSLKGNKGASKFRSVLKRYEKVKDLEEKDKWDEEKDSVYKLPKVKRIKFKVKKTKGASKEEEEAGAELSSASSAEKPAEKPGDKK